MPKYRDTILKKVKRLFFAVLLQSLWLVPLCVLIWYVKKHIGAWCADYFDLAEAKKMAQKLALQAKKTESPVIWNPGAIMEHLKFLFLSVTAFAKYNGLVTISNLSAKSISIILGIIRVVAVIYALIRIKRAYFAQKRTDSIANTVCKEVMPEIESLRAEINHLTALIEEMKHPQKDK